MRDKFISLDRKRYLRKIKIEKFAVFFTQIGILLGIIIVWELLANLKIIDSFITSQPSRILDTFLNLSSNDLLKHMGVTFYETIVGFVSRNSSPALLLQLFCGFRSFYQKSSTLF